MTELAEFHGPNAGYVAELLERYRRDPESVPRTMRDELSGWEPMAPEADGVPAGDGAIVAAVQAEADSAVAAAAAAAASLAQSIRLFGHLAARLDPLGASPPGDPQLEATTHGLTNESLTSLSPRAIGGPLARSARHAAEGIDRLRAIYCGTTGYEFSHIEEPAERSWLFETIELGRHRPPSEAVDERSLLDRLTEVSAFERFLHRAYPGQTRFSVEGLGMMIPMLDELIDRAAEAGVRTILLGMAHRGRLNVLAHVLGKPYEGIIAEFEGRVHVLRAGLSESTDEGWTGDVKYHAGGRRAYEEEAGTVTVIMAPNPSHLEFVDPVVEGMARAADEDRRGAGRPRQDETASLAVLIHGDASFPGQGVVAETLNLSRLAGYRTGGTLHLIANNQLGFTTEAADDRSTLYASDLAKGFEIPVVHVNADDPVACLAAMRLAVAYRSRFRKDFLIDLVGYRRWGHNEGDEPSFTQPRVYAAVREHPTVRERFVADLVQRAVIAPEEADALLKAGLDEFQRIREGVLAAASDVRRSTADEAAYVSDLQPSTPEPDPGISDSRRPTADELREVNAALWQFPDGFTVNRKLERNVQRRRGAFEQETPTIDWGHAETLAFATILRAGTPIRLTGQDTVRGTFSQRHLTFYDERTGQAFTPLERLDGTHASFEVWNSPLSENATLGFEYGYSIQAPESLVLWEAQYGDFINGAQTIVDEFVVSGQAKWGLRSGLVLLLPHGWEGQGPDHSSGRLERFLQLAAEDNIRIANCTTAGQYFHLLRRQAAALQEDRRPLIVLTPKSLLRHPLAAASPRDLTETEFRSVLDDARAAERPNRVRRLILCSGKVWADVESHPSRPTQAAVAVVRIEELYPFPADQVRAMLTTYQQVDEVVWLQEEPRNAGAWFFVEPRLRELIGSGSALRYVGRPERASPAEGWAEVHAAEQRRIVEAVFDMSSVFGSPSRGSDGELARGAELGARNRGA